MTTEQETLEQRLLDAGVRRRQAEEERLASARYLHGMVHEAVANHWTKTRIAEWVGISRQTVHDILRGS